MIEIEKGITMPERQNKRKVIYPFDNMNVGDSFFVGNASHAKMTAAIQYRQRKAPSRKYAARMVDGGVRVWRVS